MTKYSIAFAAVAGVFALGCGEDERLTGSHPTGGLGEDGRILEECHAMPLVGMKYSPGGNQLPNKCAPWHQTLNNPYAIRCIDALPNFQTPYAGDEYCILPPPPELGIQIGLHPQGEEEEYWRQMWAGDYSGYQNPAEEWILKPGDETTQNFRGSSKNKEAKNYYRTYFRMRTGSHHNIISMHKTDLPVGWTQDRSVGFFDPNQGERLGILGGEQRPDDGNPATLEKPPEDAGQYLIWPAEPKIVWNMHHFNTSQNNLLREGWVNIWWEEEATQEVYWYMGLEFGSIRRNIVQPNTVADHHFSWTIPAEQAPFRLLRVFGHRHYWTTNFSTWIERANGGIELLYQSFQWEDMPTYRFDSVVKNPEPKADNHSDGAESGIVELRGGDKLHFNCHIEYTDERAAQDPSAPRPVANGTLYFGNEAYKREMCIQFGNVTGGMLFLPATDTTPLPEFATK
ncbi:MAG TPA: hypothetical protein VI072_33100 [Polyangiaceae bacterium]